MLYVMHRPKCPSRPYVLEDAPERRPYNEAKRPAYAKPGWCTAFSVLVISSDSPRAFHFQSPPCLSNQGSEVLLSKMWKPLPSWRRAESVRMLLAALCVLNLPVTSLAASRAKNHVSSVKHHNGSSFWTGSPRPMRKSLVSSKLSQLLAMLGATLRILGKRPL